MIFSLFLPLLQLLFIGLKLTGHIVWSWWLVMSPALFVGTTLFFAVAFMIIGAVSLTRSASKRGW